MSKPENIKYVRLFSVTLATPFLVEAYVYIEDGRALGRTSRYVYFRVDQPIYYWVAVIKELFFAVFIFYGGLGELDDSTAEPVGNKEGNRAGVSVSQNVSEHDQE